MTHELVNDRTTCPGCGSRAVRPLLVAGLFHCASCNSTWDADEPSASAFYWITRNSVPQGPKEGEHE